jgi:hypothetical protein
MPPDRLFVRWPGTAVVGIQRVDTAAARPCHALAGVTAPNRGGKPSVHPNGHSRLPGPTGFRVLCGDAPHKVSSCILVASGRPQRGRSLLRGAPAVFWPAGSAYCSAGGCTTQSYAAPPPGRRLRAMIVARGVRRGRPVCSRLAAGNLFAAPACARLVCGAWPQPAQPPRRAASGGVAARPAGRRMAPRRLRSRSIAAGGSVAPDSAVWRAGGGKLL